MIPTGYEVITDPKEIKKYFKEYKKEIEFLSNSEAHKEILLTDQDNFKEWLEDTYDLTLEDEEEI